MASQRQPQVFSRIIVCAGCRRPLRVIRVSAGTVENGRRKHDFGVGKLRSHDNDPAETRITCWRAIAVEAPQSEAGSTAKGNFLARQSLYTMKQRKHPEAIPGSTYPPTTRGALILWVSLFDFVIILRRTALAVWRRLCALCAAQGDSASVRVDG